MNKRTVTIYQSSANELEALGQRLKDARLRRRFSMETVCAKKIITDVCKIAGDWKMLIEVRA